MLNVIMLNVILLIVVASSLLLLLTMRMMTAALVVSLPQLPVALRTRNHWKKVTS
jgi:hypothetical protein